MKGNMGADWQGDAKGPVCLDPVDIAHAARFRSRKIDCLSSLGCNFTEDLMTTNPAGGPIRKTKRQPVGPSSGGQVPVMLFQNADIHQCLTQPMNSLFRPAQTARQLSGSERFGAVRQFFEDPESP
jgi:hypothetical protein